MVRGLFDKRVGKQKCFIKCFPLKYIYYESNTICRWREPDLWISL